MQRRLARSAVVMAAVTLLATACAAAPAPSPTPTPTGFASEEEAFAAAEETYRAYVEAANAADLGDPSTFEPMYSLTTGDALASVKEEFTWMHAERLKREGTTKVTLLEPHEAALDSASVTMDVCLDVSDVVVRDQSGASVVDPERLDHQPMRIDFEIDEVKRSTLISNFAGREDGPACDA